MSGLMCFEPSLGLYFWGLLGMIAGIYIVRLGDYFYRRLIASGTPRRCGNTKERRKV